MVRVANSRSTQSDMRSLHAWGKWLRRLDLVRIAETFEYECLPRYIHPSEDAVPNAISRLSGRSSEHSKL
jgi:hypothetical protein